MIIWISSYPKSGNTLVRSILSSLIFTEDGNLNFKKLGAIPQYPKKKYFEGFTDQYSNTEELSKFWIPSQKKLNLDKQLKFLKTHHAKCNIFNNSFTDNNNTLGIIYIVRDPRDVVISFANHFSQTIEEAKNMMINSYAFTYDELDNIDKSIHILLGSWADNYNSWVKNNKNVLLIKYENLITNKKDELFKIIKFLNKFIIFNPDDSKINNCINSTSFENMKLMEEKGLFHEDKINRNTLKKIKFFNKGERQTWKNILDTKIRKEIEKKFDKEMKELGYLD